MQIGKKKMALDHALIDSMEGDEETVEDLEAVLRFGAEALFKGDDSTDIRYDTQSVEKLLDRSQIENTKTDQNSSVESQFSFARVWQNESASMGDGLAASDNDKPPPQSVWDQILEERARKAEEEASLRAEKLGRGKRQRKDVHYNHEADVNATLDDDNKSDTDFQARESEDDSPDEDKEESVLAEELQATDGIQAASRKSRGVITSVSAAPPLSPGAFRRARLIPVPTEPAPGARRCPACDKDHLVGSCPLKIAGAEHCPICGLAHFTWQRTCPHMQSETQVRAMLTALSNSPESKELVDRAKKLLQGIKGSIVQQKKRNAEAQQRAAAAARASADGIPASAQMGPGAGTPQMPKASSGQGVAPIGSSSAPHGLPHPYAAALTSMPRIDQRPLPPAYPPMRPNFGHAYHPNWPLQQPLSRDGRQQSWSERKGGAGASPASHTQQQYQTWLTRGQR